MVGVSVLIGIATVYAKDEWIIDADAIQETDSRRSLSSWGLILPIGGLGVGLLLAWGGRQTATEFARTCASALSPVLRSFLLL